MNEMKVLFVDDDEIARNTYTNWIKEAGYIAAEASSGDEALHRLADETHDVVISDIYMPDGMDGHELVRKIRASDIQQPYIFVLTGQNSRDEFSKAFSVGADAFLAKPLKKPMIEVSLWQAERHLQSTRDAVLRQASNFGEIATLGKEPIAGLLGNSEEMCRVRGLIRKYAKSPATVLIRGEPGTGKELVAHAINVVSGQTGPYIARNCSTWRGALANSEISGHVKGAFTDAKEDKVGVFEAADSGVLFMDEIGDLPIDCQELLLRILENKEVVRVGGTKTIPVRARLIAATNRELEEMAAAGEFRRDLLSRIDVLPIRLPPLRERRMDIPELVAFFLDSCAKEAGMQPRTLADIDQDALRYLQFHLDYQTGNVRELRNTIERGLALAVDGEPLTIEQFMPYGSDTSAKKEETFDERLNEFEGKLVAEYWERSGKIEGKDGMSELIGWGQSKCRDLLKKHGLFVAKRKPKTS